MKKSEVTEKRKKRVERMSKVITSTEEDTKNKKWWIITSTITKMSITLALTTNKRKKHHKITSKLSTLKTISITWAAKIVWTIPISTIKVLNLIQTSRILIKSSHIWRKRRKKMKKITKSRDLLSNSNNIHKNKINQRETTRILWKCTWRHWLKLTRTTLKVKINRNS